MARDLNASYETELDEATLWLAYIVLADFDSGYLRLWSGNTSLLWDSETWTGTGIFGGISTIEEGKGVEAPGVQLSLSGIPSAMLALALDDVYQGRSIKIWQALLTSGSVIVGDPALVFSGYMDVMEIADGGESGMITLSCVGRSAELDRTRELRYTQNEQERLFTGDEGLEYVAALQNRPLYWGSHAPYNKMPPEDRGSDDPGVFGPQGPGA